MNLFVFFRHSDLGSVSMPQNHPHAGCSKPCLNSAAWMLKQVQHDGGAFQ
jgi:hypothetical protein